MPRITGPTAQGLAALMPYFNSILGAVEQGATTKDLWDAVKNAAEMTGGYIQGATPFDMNTMAGYARSIVSAEGSFASAAGGQAVDSTMWAWAPWAAGQTDSWLSERYQIRYQATLVGPGGETKDIWGVDMPELPLGGMMVDQVLARAMTSAQEALDSGSPRVQAQLGMVEGFSLSDISRVQIMRL